MASRAIVTVTEATQISAYHWEINLGVRKQPEYEIIMFYQKPNSFQEDTPVSIQAAREYLALIWGQYQGASRKVKTKLIDEVSRNLKIHRKSVIRLLNGKAEPRQNQGKKGGGRKPYSDASKKALVQLWRDMGYMGSLRMKAVLPEWLDAYSYSMIPGKIRQELKRMSARTIERFLTEAKADLRRSMNTGTKRGTIKLVTEVPIRDFDFVPDEPGHCEIDTVAHCGGSLSGTFAWSLTLTDIKTGWTETYALWGKTGSQVAKALEALKVRMPFPIKCLYADNGSEFINDEVINDFVKKHGLEIFRSRPYRKNDQCHVEQKNFTHVRALMGYGRIDWEPAVKMMNNVYENHWRLVQNYYCPQQKLISKIRVGSRLIRKMSEPKTPFQRLAPFLVSSKHLEMLAKKKSINPKESMRKLRTATRNIFSYFKHEMDRSQWGKIVI